jgi:hypothetical protein
LIKDLMWPELVAAGCRPHRAVRRVLDDIRFSGDALLTDIATITLLLGCLTPGDGAP